MDNELRNIVNQTAAQKNLKVTPATLEHLENYDDKWRSRGGNKWNTPLIQAVLADSAIRFAEQEGRDVIEERDARRAILEWHGEGDPTECLAAGLNIIDESRKSDFADRLDPDIAAYVKKINS